MSLVVSSLRKNLLLVLVLGLSIVFLAIGMSLTAPDKNTKANLATSELPADFTVPPLPELSTAPPAELAAIQTALADMSKGVMPTGQTFSSEVIAEALAGATLGSETWCDILLIKADAEWTETESLQFAEHCI